MSIPGPSTNHYPENGLIHMCIVECPNDHKSFRPQSSGEFTSKRDSTCTGC